MDAAGSCVLSLYLPAYALFVRARSAYTEKIIFGMMGWVSDGGSGLEM
jgi:hypothetical protein